MRQKGKEIKRNATTVRANRQRQELQKIKEEDHRVIVITKMGRAQVERPLVVVLQIKNPITIEIGTEIPQSK